MSRLLLPLETLCQKHSDVVIQELASNLRSVIATHGAYRPTNLTTPAQPPKISETAKNSMFSRKSPKLQTESSNLQAVPHSPLMDGNLPCNTGHPAASTSTQDDGSASRISDTCDSTKPFSEWLLEACDPDVPTRAFALRVLTQMVKNRHPEAVQAQEKVFMVGSFSAFCCSIT